MVQEFIFMGRKAEEIKSLTLKEFMKMIPSRQRRTLSRGFKEKHKKFLERLRKSSKPVKTHLRDMIVLPEMIGRSISIHNGREYVQINIVPEMVGHYLGEFALTRKNVSHSAPGIGATKSSAAVSVR